jgi:type I restriction enzyme S subunit
MENFQQTKLGLLPEEWGLIKSKDFCYKVTDGTHDTPEPQSDGFFLVTSKNLIDNKIDFSSCYYISKQDFNQINQRSAVNQYDVLFGMIGTVGNTAIVTQKEIDFAIKNVGLFKLDGNYDKAIWLKNYFSSNIFSNYLRKQMAGTTQQFVGLGFLRKTPIIIPQINKEKIDLLTIRSINYVLSKVDEAIEATQKSIKAAEKLKKALMQNLLTGKLKPDGTWRSEDEFYEDEKFGKVPKGWHIIKGNKITSKITKGQSPKWQGFEYQEKGILFITSENVRDGYIEIENPKYLPIEFHNKIKNSQLQKGDVLINIVGASIGRSAVFNLDVEYANTNQAVCVFRPNAENDSNFLAFYIQDGFTQQRLLGTQVETARANLSLGDFRKFKFVIPETKDEQILISDKINEVNTAIESKQTKIRTLQRLKKSLMQNLLTGKVRLDVEKVNKILKEQEL